MPSSPAARKLAAQQRAAKKELEAKAKAMAREAASPVPSSPGSSAFGERVPMAELLAEREALVGEIAQLEGFGGGPLQTGDDGDGDGDEAHAIAGESPLRRTPLGSIGNLYEWSLSRALEA